jgi:hypothetical protein
MFAKFERFVRTVTQAHPADKSALGGQKRGDENSIVWFHITVGCWMFMLSTLYVGDQYGYVGSDSTRTSLVVCRNPR